MTESITNLIFLSLQSYIKSDETGRTVENTNIMQVKQGYEPLNFTGYFQAWDPEKWSVRYEHLIIYFKLALITQFLRLIRKFHTFFGQLSQGGGFRYLFCTLCMGCLSLSNTKQLLGSKQKWRDNYAI